MLQGNKRNITQSERKTAMVVSAVIAFLYAVSLVTDTTYAIYFIVMSSATSLLVASFYGAKIMPIIFNVIMGSASLYLILQGIRSSSSTVTLAYVVVSVKLLYSIAMFWVITSDKQIKI